MWCRVTMPRCGRSSPGTTCRGTASSSPARCRARTWPPTTGPPACTFRSASTRGSAPRSSRRWPATCRCWRTLLRPCPRRWATPACSSGRRTSSGPPSFSTCSPPTRRSAAPSSRGSAVGSVISATRSSSAICGRSSKAPTKDGDVRVGFVVQRYGTEILGGSEYHCRLIAERLAERHQVDVLTTCARDYVTWKNEYPDSPDRIRGVTVRRFANARTRDIASFNRYSEWIFNHAHTRDDELEWLKQQGPWCPALIEYLERHHASYDALVFFTYLYAPTVLGLRVAPGRSVLVPTAHDEPAIRLGIYNEVFSRPAAIAYNTEVERKFLATRFATRAPVEETVGCGVDLPQHHAYSRPASGEALPGPEAGTVEVEGAEGPRGGDDSQPRYRSHLTERGAAFRRRHRIHGPFALYGGR